MIPAAAWTGGLTTQGLRWSRLVQEQEETTPPVLQTLLVQQPWVLKAVCAFHLLPILKVYVNNSNYWQRQGVLQLRVCTQVSRCHLQG